MTRPNKLECLHLAKTFQSSLTFAGITRSLPRRKHLKGAPIGLALALPSNSKTRLERVSKDKHYSLFGRVVSDEVKKFHNIDTRLRSNRRCPLAETRGAVCRTRASKKFLQHLLAVTSLSPRKMKRPSLQGPML
jgi:hypothetical protein